MLEMEDSCKLSVVAFVVEFEKELEEDESVIVTEQKQLPEWAVAVKQIEKKKKFE